MINRSAVNTPNGNREAVLSIQKTIEPPIAISARDRFYFDIVVESREGVTWTRNDLMAAVHLAKCYTRLEALQNDIEREGFTQTNARGTEVSNPKMTALASATMAMQTLTRILGLTATQKGLAHPSQRDRNRAEQKIREGLDTEDDELI